MHSGIKKRLADLESLAQPSRHLDLYAVSDDELERAYAVLKAHCYDEFGKPIPIGSRSAVPLRELEEKCPVTAAAILASR